MTRWVAKRAVKVNGALVRPGEEIVCSPKELGMLPRNAIVEMEERRRIRVVRPFRFAGRRLEVGTELIVSHRLAVQLGRRLVEILADATGQELSP